uniref:Uncharacterized protein n=1 Tax=Parascaris univalens TaxID=6257 RepID=A0A915BGW7_PARUN
MRYGDVVVIATAMLIVGRVECDENITIGCNSHCTLEFDKDLECWNRTLAYFSDVLVGMMKRYAYTQTNIIHWQKHHGLQPANVENIIKESVDRMEKIKPSTFDDDEGIIDRNIMTILVTTVVRASMVNFHYNHENLF